MKLKYFVLIIPVLITACSKDDLVFEIGGKYVNEHIRILFTDTLSVDSYTVKWDSIITSNFATGLTGVTDDSIFGSMHARSYVDLRLPSLRSSIPNDAVFDSLRVVLVYNGYSLGDTTQLQTLYVNRLEENLKEREDGYLYNTSSFSYDPIPLGQVAFTPRPSGKDSIRIRLSDALGLELFNALKNKDDIVMDQSSFETYLKGFVIDPDENNTCVLGFHVKDTIPLMQLYYHYFDFEEVHKRLDFVRQDPKVQFNQISSDNQAFMLPAEQRGKVIASENEGKSYIQAGTGVFTRLEIPYFENFRELNNNIEILHADLIFEPVRDSYTKNSLPVNVSAYFTDNSNRFVSVLEDLTGLRQVAGLKIDELYHEDTRYTMDVTAFINAKLKEQSDEIPALLVTIGPDDVYTKLDKLVLGSRWHEENEVLLEVYYMIYE